MLPVILYLFNVQESICNVFEINVIFTFSIPISKMLYNFHRNQIENEYLVFSSAAITENYYVCGLFNAIAK